MKLKNILIGILEGVRTGGFIYLLVLALGIQKAPVTSSNIISILIMSALIGIISQIFEITDRFSYLALLLIHFLITAFLACAMMIYNGWSYVILGWHFWLDFVLIYLFIWLFLRISVYLKTQKINTALQKRRKTRGQKET